MSKSLLRQEAVNLRQKGESVTDIAQKINVSKSSASLWTRHVILSFDQLQVLKHKAIVGAEKGRGIGSLNQKLKRLNKIEQFNQAGEKDFKNLSYSELRIAGLALYWSEGSKKARRIELCNSDPNLINFFINWLDKIYHIPKSDLKCYVGINEVHKNRETEVKSYWAGITGITLDNFTKTSFKKYPLRKVYENFDQHYGTLSVKMKKSARIYYKILGQIHGLSMAT